MASPTEIASASPLEERAIFGEPPLVVLKAYSLTRTSDALVLRLYWQPLRQSEVPLSVFLHLVRTGEERPRAQADQQPLHASDRWPIGALQREIHTLSIGDLPPGEYELRAGWYDAATGARSLISGAGDSLRVATLRLP